MDKKEERKKKERRKHPTQKVLAQLGSLERSNGF